MICILHGYLLEGSGSNLWTRSVVESLCRQGQEVHLVAQENHPERYEFISEWRQYPPEGPVTTRMKRESPLPGSCILHQPLLGDLLPVYVWDRYEEFPRVVPMVDLSDEEIEDYLHRNVRALLTVVRDNAIRAIHANHSVLMSVVAQRVSEAAGIPFTVMPHGSALEFAVKRDARFHRRAAAALTAASRIFVMGDEMRERVRETFPDLPALADKFCDLHLGVDTRQFRPIPRSARSANVAALGDALSGVPRGKTAQQSEEMRAGLRAGIAEAELRRLFAEAQRYDGKAPDADLESKLAAVDWDTARTLLFVGRLISTKGVHAVITALPLLLERTPDLRLLVVGHGPLREPLEAMLWALEHGARDVVERIVRRGVVLEGSVEGASESTALTRAARFLEGLEAEGRLDDYYEAARRRVRADRVIFTGYLTHRELRYLFPCCDAAVFPSVVREAGPLVFLEALASGVFPLGTYFGGMKASIDTVGAGLPPAVADLMKLDAAPEGTVRDIVRKTPAALAVEGAHREALCQLARERFDWTSVARILVRELEAL
ncbi:MAG TPA: glycosyltransferase [Longimicrobiaceae bacterium]